MNEMMASSTPTSVVIILGIAASVAAGTPTWPEPEPPYYRNRQGVSSYSAVESALSDTPDSGAQNFGRDIADVYVLLSEGQEPFGAEFEAVWNANAAYLYES